MLLFTAACGLAVNSSERIRMSINIAIDGPAGAGKSTVARQVAKELSFIYVDTGAMYRAIALYMLRTFGPDASREEIISSCHEARIGIRYEDSEQIVLLNGCNVNDSLRTEEVSRMASVTSALPEVRAYLLKLQRDLAREYDVVMDGRDIGTTILPDAQVKIFLTASAETRAMRRTMELQEKGTDCDYAQILQEIRERDLRDTSRSASPLRQAEDAVLVDSSGMTIAQVTQTILELVREKTGIGKG